MSCGAVVVEVQEHQGCGDDCSDAPGVEADVAEGSEGHLEQGVGAFADGADAVVGLVELLLLGGEVGFLGFLERDGDGVGLALVAQVAERA